MLIGHQDINITADSKHLLSRVPVTNPSARGPLAKLSLNKLSKEHHTIRKAALSMLLHHPYICGMRGMIVHQHHYMVFEYVNGDQMNIYYQSRQIERGGWKFAGRIGSALDYCHRNNVVHRGISITFSPCSQS